MEVTPCLVTRGDVELDRILESFPKHWRKPIVWDNSQGNDLAVYGRYAAIAKAKSDVVYVQDDDCVLPPASFRELESHYQQAVITANMPIPFRAHYEGDSCLIGFGAIFDRDLPLHAFGKLYGNVGIRMLKGKPRAQFLRTCDVYFTAIHHGMRWLDLPYENLPWATDDNRMYRQKTHVGERAKALEHARSLR